MERHGEVPVYHPEVCNWVSERGGGRDGQDRLPWRYVIGSLEGLGVVHYR